MKILASLCSRHANTTILHEEVGVHDGRDWISGQRFVSSYHHQAKAISVCYVKRLEDSSEGIETAVLGCTNI